MAGIIEANLPKADYSWAHQDSPEQIAKSAADRAAIAAWEQQSAASAPAQQINTAGDFGAGGIVASAMPAAPKPDAFIGGSSTFDPRTGQKVEPSSTFSQTGNQPAQAATTPAAPSIPAWGASTPAAPKPPAVAGVPAAPAPTATAPGVPAPTAAPAATGTRTPRQVIDMLPWTPETEAASAQKLWDARQANGWTSEQLGKEVGFTGPEIDAWFTRLGIGQKPGIVNAAQLGDPTKWNVTPEQTVEGRIASIIQDKSHPLQVIARTNAAEEANARGLVNSAMAVSAGEKAAFEAAMPIAQADAATFAKASGYDADQSNQFDVRNVDAENQFRLAAMQNDQQGQLQKDVALINRETQRQLAQLDIQSRTQADKVAIDNKVLLETNAQAASAFNTAMSAINNVNLSQTMDADAKTQAVANVWRDLQTQLKVMGAVAGLDLTKTLNFAGYPGFDSGGQFVGFEDGAGAVTRGSVPAPPAAPPQAAVFGAPGAGVIGSQMGDGGGA